MTIIGPQPLLFSKNIFKLNNFSGINPLSVIRTLNSITCSTLISKKRICSKEGLAQKDFLQRVYDTGPSGEPTQTVCAKSLLIESWYQMDQIIFTLYSKFQDLNRIKRLLTVVYSLMTRSVQFVCNDSINSPDTEDQFRIYQYLLLIGQWSKCKYFIEGWEYPNNQYI